MTIGFNRLLLDPEHKTTNTSLTLVAKREIGLGRQYKSLFS